MTKGQHKKTTTTKRFRVVEWVYMNLPFVCYLALLGVIYIFNMHSVDKKLRHIDSLKSEVNDTRWRYMDIKQEIMYGSTQSQVEEKVADLKLKPLKKVPVKISKNE